MPASTLTSQPHFNPVTDNPTFPSETPPFAAAAATPTSAQDSIPGSTPNEATSSSPVTEATLQVLQEGLSHRELQIEAMRRISEALFSQRSIDAIVRETLIIAINTVGASAGSLQMHDPVQDELVFKFVVGPYSEQLVGFRTPASQGISGHVFRTGQPHISADIEQTAQFNRVIDERTGYTTRAMATIPIKRPGSSPIGVMQILNFAETYDQHDLEVLEVIAGQAALAFENARLEQQARKAAMVNLIGDISHDIKNMLTPIQTGVWTLDPLLRETFDDLCKICAQMPEEWGQKIMKASKMAREEYEWILQNALDATDRVQMRTKEIADAVKGVSAPPRFVESDFNLLCQEVIAGLRLVAHDHMVDLIPDFDPSLPNVQFDRKLIYNALYNLVNNAIPETPEGGQVTLRTRRLGPGETNFLVEVSDTGRGMPVHVRERLFTDEAISTKPGGTGLGTRIVADVVRRHRGQISVQSEPNVGTTFTILLPHAQDS